MLILNPKQVVIMRKSRKGKLSKKVIAWNEYKQMVPWAIGFQTIRYAELMNLLNEAKAGKIPQKPEKSTHPNTTRKSVLWAQFKEKYPELCTEGYYSRVKATELDILLNKKV